MSRPLFSCVIAVKGARPYMGEALASLCSQGLSYGVKGFERFERCEGGANASLPELEIIVQDGDVESDKGQSDAFNKGFAKARGEWFFWLNSDDILLPGALVRVKDLIRSSTSTTNFGSLSWIAGNMLRIDKEGRTIGASVGGRWHDWLHRHAVPHVYGPSSFFRRELWEKVGGCDPTLHYCMDWDLWIRFMRAGARYERIPDYLWAMRSWEGSKTNGNADAAELERQGAEVRRMLAKNKFEVTRGGVWRYQLWRLLSGCYLKEWLQVGKTI